MPGYYELKSSSNGKPMFNLVAANHEIILTSELYESKAAALAGIDSVRANGTSLAAFEKRSSSADQPYFVLKAPNGLIIGSSQMYSSDAARDTGIASVITHAATTETKEV